MTARAVIAAALLWAAPAAAERPLSAIDWLDQTPTVTLDLPVRPTEPPVTETGDIPDVNVAPLGEPGHDAVGLLPGSITGLPASLWQYSTAETLARLIRDQRADGLPAMQALLYTLLLAEANPPADAGTDNRLLHARIDALIELGALEQANALLERAGADTPELFARWFDVTLLMGQEDNACEALMREPHLAPGYAARVFCTARSGDWATAALTLDNARALGLITDEEDALLLRFLDPELIEGAPLLVAHSAPTPLTFRLYEAIGEPMPTLDLPRAFAHADLRSTAGWKARLEAAERLARTGALPGNQLLGIYSEGEPAASGMVWDRVDALQEFDRAIRKGDRRRTAETLPRTWQAMRAAHLEVPFARLFGPELLNLRLRGTAGELAREIGLLSDAYERAAERGPNDFLAGLARGRPPRRAADPARRAIAHAFHDAGVPQTFISRLAVGQLGEVLLETMQLMQRGEAGDLPALTKALATLRAVGLEDTARRAALQVALLDRRG